jgi:hypothetical protein
MLQDDDLAPLQGRDDFRSVLAECTDRRREAQRGAKPGLVILAPPDEPRDRVPVLMALHGRDGRGEDFAPYWEGATALGWLLALPTSSQILSPYGFGWDDRELAERDVAWAYEQAGAAHPIDPGRIVFAGFSQGGATAIRMTLKGEAVPPRGFLVVAPSRSAKTRMSSRRGFPQRRSGACALGSTAATETSRWRRRKTSMNGSSREAWLLSSPWDLTWATNSPRISRTDSNPRSASWPPTERLPGDYLPIGSHGHV